MSKIKATQKLNNYGVCERGKHWHNTVVSDDRQIFFVLGYLGNGGTNTRQHIDLVWFQQRHDQLQTADKISHRLAWILLILTTLCFYIWFDNNWSNSSCLL